MNATTTTPAPLPCGLTARQLTVIAGRARGHQAPRIADDLGLKIGAVKYALLTAANALGVRVCGAAIVDAAYRAGVMRGLPPEPAPDVVLSARQQQLLRDLAEGLTDAELGRRRGRSVNTVKTNVKHLLEALGAVNRDQAVALGHQHGLFTAPTDLDVLRVRFAGRVRVFGGNVVHASDGVRRACGPGLGRSTVVAGRERVSCQRCCGRLRIAVGFGRDLAVAS